MKEADSESVRVREKNFGGKGCVVVRHLAIPTSSFPWVKLEVDEPGVESLRPAQVMSWREGSTEGEM